MGDPAGIGPEITIRALNRKETYEKCRPVVTGDACIMREAVKLLGYDLQINDKELDWILIGGTYYRPTSSGHLKLFYSDDRIFVRSEGAEPVTIELKPDDSANMRFSSLTFATLFPYVNAHIGEMNKVFIPKADKTEVPLTNDEQVQSRQAGILLGDPTGPDTPGRNDIDEYEALARQIKR